MKLQPELSSKFWDLVSKSTEESEQDDIPSSYASMAKAWDLIPEPKNQYDLSFVAAKCLAGMYLRDGNIGEAEKWAEILMSCDIERPETGEREVMKAMVHFEKGEFTEAKRLFEIVDHRSRGRLWKSIDKKYFKFFKTKN